MPCFLAIKIRSIQFSSWFLLSARRSASARPLRIFSHSLFRTLVPESWNSSLVRRQNPIQPCWRYSRSIQLFIRDSTFGTRGIRTYVQAVIPNGNWIDLHFYYWIKLRRTFLFIEIYLSCVSLLPLQLLRCFFLLQMMVFFVRAFDIFFLHIRSTLSPSDASCCSFDFGK